MIRDENSEHDDLRRKCSILFVQLRRTSPVVRGQKFVCSAHKPCPGCLCSRTTVMSQTVTEDVFQICSRHNMRVEDIINFINIYRLYPCLWNPKDDNYRSRIVRKEATNEIALLIGATPLEVEKKIAMVLAQNRRARRKAVVLRKKGMSESQIETLVWYGYKHFSYLNELHREKKVRAIILCNITINIELTWYDVKHYHFPVVGLREKVRSNVQRNKQIISLNF